MNEDPGENQIPTPDNGADVENTPVQPAEEGMVAETNTEESNTSSEGNYDPASRPMEQAPVIIPEEKPKNKKLGLIIGMVICLFVAAGCGVAALLIAANPGTKDPVSEAVSKLMNRQSPANVAMRGDITVTMNNPEIPFSALTIDLEAETTSTSLVNSTSAKLILTLRNGNDISLRFDEVYGANGDLYLKIDGVASVLSDQKFIQSLMGGEIEAETNCVTDETGMTNCVSTDIEYQPMDCLEGEDCTGIITQPVVQQAFDPTLILLSIVDTIDGKWLKLSIDELGSLSENITTEGSMSCMVDFMTNASESSNSFAGIYNRNPFVSSSTENISVLSKNDPVYRVEIDDKIFTNFVESSKDSKAMSELFNCLGYENAVVNTDNVAEEIAGLPPIFVEVNENYDITRLYIASDLNDGEAKMVADIEFSYPANINVSEPTEYQDVSTILQSLFFSQPTEPTIDF